MTYEEIEMDACGECPLGKCDKCEMCLWHESLPGAKPHRARVYKKPQKFPEEKQ